MQEQEQYIKEKVKERYAKIALTGNSDCCCMPGECCNDDSNSHPKIQNPFLKEQDAAALYAAVISSVLVGSVFAIAFVQQQALAQGNQTGGGGDKTAGAAGSNRSSNATGGGTAADAGPT